MDVHRIPRKFVALGYYVPYAFGLQRTLAYESQPHPTERLKSR